MENEPDPEKVEEFRVCGTIFLGSLALEGIAIGLHAAGIDAGDMSYLELGALIPMGYYGFRTARALWG